MDFQIICTGYNCSRYVRSCYDSVMNQSLKTFTLHMVDDGSTDNTRNALRALPDNARLKRYYHKANRGAAKRRWQVIKDLPGDTIVLLLGMDDELLPHCLDRVSKEYARGKWMTYGNWINQNGDGLPKDFDLHFSDEVHALRDYRRVRYRSTAPNTFYARLFNQIPVSDFMIEGKWIDTTTESETMLSCLEMCGKERIGVIEEPIYLYRQNLPGGTQRRLGQAYKNQVYLKIISRPKKDLL